MLQTEHMRDQLPRRDAVTTICREHLRSLLHAYFCQKSDSAKVQELVEGWKRLVVLPLEQELTRAQVFYEHSNARSTLSPKQLIDAVIEQAPQLFHLFLTDIDAAFDNDPAAPNREQILLSYPAADAIAIQRLAHCLNRLGAPFIPRMMTETAHRHTGIDIHPGAAIGEFFFIDHGTGVVIGETATIGNHVTLYHGVTLGAFNPLARDEAGELLRGQQNKRHPDVEDHVTVYPNATILGGHTRVGHHSVIGGNVWLTHSVPPYSKVTLREGDPQVMAHEPG